MSNIYEFVTDFYFATREELEATQDKILAEGLIETLWPDCQNKANSLGFTELTEIRLEEDDHQGDEDIHVFAVIKLKGLAVMPLKTCRAIVGTRDKRYLHLSDLLNEILSVATYYSFLDLESPWSLEDGYPEGQVPYNTDVDGHVEDSGKVSNKNTENDEYGSHYIGNDDEFDGEINQDYDLNIDDMTDDEVKNLLKTLRESLNSNGDKVISLLPPEVVASIFKGNFGSERIQSVLADMDDIQYIREKAYQAYTGMNIPGLAWSINKLHGFEGRDRISLNYVAKVLCCLTSIDDFIRGKKIKSA